MSRVRECSKAVLVTVASLLFAMPVLGLLWSTPWQAIPELLHAPEVRASLWISGLACGSAAGLALLLGLPLALWLAAGRSRLRKVVRCLVLLPILLPPVVAGIALLLAFGRAGLLGQPLHALTGLSLPFSPAGAALVASYMGVPFFVLTAEAGLRALDPRPAQVAATLGAGPWRRLCTITLPALAPSFAAGMLLCCMRALGEFCATQMFAGNVAGATRTLPLLCGVWMESKPELAIALSALLAITATVALFVLLGQRQRQRA